MHLCPSIREQVKMTQFKVQQQRMNYEYVKQIPSKYTNENITYKYITRLVSRLVFLTKIVK